MLKQKLAVLTVFSLMSLASAAGPVDDANAHFKVIAEGQVDKIMAAYASDAEFQWVGGPLDGSYKTADAIHGVWTKFAKANAPLTVSVDKISESTNPKGSTVTANVTFSGKNTIKVRYVLTYREGKLVNEVWQIDPKLAAMY